MSILLPTPLPVASVRRPFWKALAMSLVVMGGFVAVLKLLQSQWELTPSYMVLLIPVAFSAWYGGSRPASLTALAGLLTMDVWLVSPGVWLPRTPLLWMDAGAFAFGAFCILLFASSFRRQIRELSDRLVATEAEAQRYHLNEMNLRSSVRRLDDEARIRAQELTRLATRLRSSEERMRVAQESARFCLFDWSHPGDGIVVFGDPAPLFGVDRGAWRGKDSLLAKVHPEDAERLGAVLEAMPQARRPLDVEVRFGAGEQPRWIAVRGQTAFTRQGDPARTIGIFLDVTEKKLTEQMLLRTEKLAAAGRLAAAIAHEVNNPLAAATNLMYIIKGDGSLSRSGRQYVEMAEQELARLGRIARRTLGFYRESTSPSKVDLAAVLDAVLETYARNLPAGIKVRKHYRPGPSLEVVEGEIRQVLGNVLVNAVQAMGDRGTIDLKVEPALRPGGNGWLIVVQDSGPGIPDCDLGSLFEPFFTRKGAGTGLGLWIARQIIERHGGSIAVESRTGTEQHGTTVTIFLPQEQPQAQPAESVA